jgi:hypothetical protein
MKERSCLTAQVNCGTRRGMEGYLHRKACHSRRFGGGRLRLSGDDERFSGSANKRAGGQLTVVHDPTRCLLSRVAPVQSLRRPGGALATVESFKVQDNLLSLNNMQNPSGSLYLRHVAARDPHAVELGRRGCELSLKGEPRPSLTDKRSGIGE